MFAYFNEMHNVGKIFINIDNILWFTKIIERETGEFFFNFCVLKGTLGVV